MTYSLVVVTPAGSNIDMQHSNVDAFNERVEELEKDRIKWRIEDKYGNLVMPFHLRHVRRR